MKNLYRATALAAALSVVACAAPPPQAAAAAAPAPAADEKIAQKAARFRQEYDSDICMISSKCEIVVLVKTGCVIEPHPYIYGIPRGFGEVDITWTIDRNSDGDPQFTADGITFKTPNTEFSDPRRTGKAFKLKDKNSLDPSNPKRELNYTIKVTQGTTVCKKDPTVINDY